MKGVGVETDCEVIKGIFLSSSIMQPAWRAYRAGRIPRLSFLWKGQAKEENAACFARSASDMLNTWNLNSTIIHSPVELLSWVQISWFIDCIISNTYINVENRLLSIYNSQKAFLIKPFLKFNCVSSFVSSLTAMSSFLVHLWVR